MDASTHTITIGAVEPLSGPNAVYGENAFGTEAYIDYVNAHGGVNGWKLRLITLDDQYEPTLAVSGAKELVDSDHVFSLVGVGGTPPGQAILPYAVQSGVPDIGMSMDTGYLQVKYPSAEQLYGFQPSTSALTAFSVQYAATHLHATKIGVFYGDDATGTPTVPAAQYIASQDHVQVIPVAIPDSATDYSGYVAKMASAKPQVVISWGAPPLTIGIIKAAPMPSMMASPIIIMPTEVDIDVMNEPTAKITAPKTNMRLRPKRSPRRPPVMVKAASMSE